MKFVRTIPGYNHLWAVRDEDKETDELSLLFRQWSNFNEGLIMKQKTLDFLEAHQSEKPSTFTEDAKWRQENEVWLKWSRGIALSIVDYMQENNFSRSDIAAKLGVSPQYVSRILSGTTNFSFKSIAEIERRLGISCMEAAMA